MLIERWRHHYNTVRPHSALSYRTPSPQTIIAQPVEGTVRRITNGPRYEGQKFCISDEIEVSWSEGSFECGSDDNLERHDSDLIPLS